MRPRNEHRSWSPELVLGIFQNTICIIYGKVYHIVTIVDRFSDDYSYLQNVVYIIVSQHNQ